MPCYQSAKHLIRRIVSPMAAKGTFRGMKSLSEMKCPWCSNEIEPCDGPPGCAFCADWRLCACGQVHALLAHLERCECVMRISLDGWSEGNKKAR